MKKILIFLLLTAMLASTVPALANVYTPESDDGAVMTGGITPVQGLAGYNGAAASVINGAAEWRDTGFAGVYRLYYWMPVNENGAENADFVIESEFTKKTVNLNFADGNMGWREITFAQSGPVGISVVMNKPSVGNSYATAIHFERLGEGYIQLLSFMKASPDHIIISPDTDIAYSDEIRVKLSCRPVVDNGSVYVPWNDIGKLINKTVRYTDFEKVTLKGREMVNLSALYTGEGQSFVYDNSLYMFSSAPMNLDADADKVKLKTILTIMRAEKM